MNVSGVMIRFQTRIMLMFFIVMLSGTCSSNTGHVPPHIEKEIPQAQLWGQGTFTWFWLKIYDARLWVGESGVPLGSAGSTNFILDLQYARNLDGIDIAEASLNEMQKAGAGSPQQQQLWFTQMKNIFPNVKNGTHISGVYLPNQGARFYLNGKFLGEVLDPAFAHAFFDIWLGPRTSDKNLRSALLSGPVVK